MQTRLLPTGPERARSEIYVCDWCGHRHYYARPPQHCPQPRCFGPMTPERNTS